MKIVKIWALKFTVFLIRKMKFRKDGYLDQDYMRTRLFSFLSLFLCSSLSLFHSLPLSLDSAESMTYSMYSLLYGVW